MLKAYVYTSVWHLPHTKITLSIIGGLGNNISGETTTNHNHLERIDTADETVSQYKAYDAIHLSENADEQKPDNEPTRNIGAVSQVTYRGQGDTGHNQRHVMKVRTRTSEKAENRHTRGSESR